MHKHVITVAAIGIMGFGATCALLVVVYPNGRGPVGGRPTTHPSPRDPPDRLDAAPRALAVPARKEQTGTHAAGKESAEEPTARESKALSVDPRGDGLDKSLLLLAEVADLGERYEDVNAKELRALCLRLQETYGARAAEIFDERIATGRYEWRQVVPPVPSVGDLEQQYGCKLGISVGPLEADGTCRLEVVLYPRAEYPELYELHDAYARLFRVAYP